MGDRILFHLDEHIGHGIAGALRRHGVDVTTAVGAGLRTVDDAAQFNHARAAGRVLVTDDAGFIRFAASVADHPGIVVCHREALSAAEMIRGLILVFEVLTPAEIARRIEYL